MHLRRFTRLTNGFSKKLENLEAAVSVFMARGTQLLPRASDTPRNPGYGSGSNGSRVDDSGTSDGPDGVRISSMKRAILIIGVSLTLLMVLFPPLQAMYLDTKGNTTPVVVGYGLVFESYRNAQAPNGLYIRTPLSVAWPRLITQLSALWVIGIAAWLLTPARATRH